MIKIASAAALTALLLLSLPVFGADSSAANQRHTQQVMDKEIRQLIIQQSIRSYSGTCPCPYNAARNGSQCGKRSAYSRPGGKSPLCYEEDVSQAMVEQYRKRQ